MSDDKLTVGLIRRAKEIAMQSANQIQPMIPAEMGDVLHGEHLGGDMYKLTTAKVVMVLHRDGCIDMTTPVYCLHPFVKTEG
jgi:CheY-specific phosphatase CheX